MKFVVEESIAGVEKVDEENFNVIENWYRRSVLLIIRIICGTNAKIFRTPQCRKEYLV